MDNDFSIQEIERRLFEIFEGYLGADTGATPDELQINFHLILQIIRFFKNTNINIYNKTTE